MIAPRRSFLVQVRDGDRVVVEGLRTQESVRLRHVSEAHASTNAERSEPSVVAGSFAGDGEAEFAG